MRDLKIRTSSFSTLEFVLTYGAQYSTLDLALESLFNIHYVLVYIKQALSITHFQRISR
jgi:hypothetical protein